MRVATDIGGTFTDLVAVDDDGKVTVGKSDTTPGNFEKGIFDVIEKADISLKDVKMFFHGTTVVINALTEKKGVKTGLITTKGFRDVLEIARGNRPDLFNTKYKKPRPTVDRHLRKEVSERLNYKGEVLNELDLKEVDEIIDYFKKENVEAIAISLLHSYKNSDHEERIATHIEEKWPEVYVTTSHELSKEWREYERSSTAALNAYVKPIANQYLSNLESKMKDQRTENFNFIMQSNGGTSTFDVAKTSPINMVESGPVAGIFGASILGEILGEKNLIVLDIGGTTAKCSLIEDGNVKISTNYHLEQTTQYAGYPVKVPVVDIVEIGNGGGSIAWIDDSGSVKVGPKSAGAHPGPIAYGKGGEEPTTTDANVLLGRLSLKNFDASTEIENIEKKFQEKIGRRLQSDTEQVAMGIVKIANSNMLNALKLVSVRKGYDPRDFTMVAIGGGGPMHSQDLAKELGVKKVIIPATSPVFASWGMLMSDLRHDYSQTLLMESGDADFDRLNKEYQKIIDQAKKTLKQEGMDEGNVVISKSIDMRYKGQEHTVEVPVPYENLNQDNLDSVIQDFHNSHERLYSYTLPENGTEIVNIKAKVLGKLEKPKLSKETPDKGEKLKEERQVYFEDSGWTNVKVYAKEFLSEGERVDGPAIVEEKTSSTILNDGDALVKDAYGNMIISIRGNENVL